MFGCGVLNDLHAQKMPGKKAMVVISNGQSMKRTGTLQRLLEQLEEAEVGAEVQVKSHVEGALKVGNTKEEIVCALVHASGYMGIPRLFNALNTCKDLLKND